MKTHGNNANCPTVQAGMATRCPGHQEVADFTYNIFSLEHDAWWRPNHSGYTTDQSLAGEYTRAEAIAIVMDHTPPGEEIAVRSGGAVDIAQLRRAAKAW